MNNININTNTSAIPNWEQFLGTCREAWEKVAALAPSDSFINISVSQAEERFVIQFTLASQEFKFAVENRAVSPFAALESGLRDSLDRVKKWSLTRQLQTT